MKSPDFLEEKDLLTQVALGHEASFESLFRIYHERLFHYISTFIKSRQIAEELVTDVFMKIWLGRELLPQIENFGSFLFRVAHNKSIDFLRAAANDPQFRDLLWEKIQLSGSERADASVLSHEFEQKVREAVALLSPQRKKVYEMSRDEEMSHEQIAYHLGLSRHTVNNHIVEAKRFIRSYLAKNLDIAYLVLLAAGNEIRF